MKNNYMTMKIAVVLAALVLSTAASAAECLSADGATDDSNNFGRAIYVQVDQGQGSIDCSSFVGVNDVMHQVEITLTGGVDGTGTVDDPLRWSVTDPDTHVDMLFTSNQGDGSRCTAGYTGNATAGYAGAGIKTNKDSTVVACADNTADAQPAPTPTPPIATDGDNDCATNPDTAEFQTLIDKNPQFHGLVLFGPGVAEGSSGICTSKTLGQPAGESKAKLKGCVNRCIKPGETPDVVYNTPRYTDPSQYEACTGDGPFYPIECRVCELHTDVQADPNNESTPFCWEQIQKAVTGDGSGNGNGSFKKAPGSKGKQTVNIDRKHGSDCYLIDMKTASGWPYSYWFPADTCP